MSLLRRTRTEVAGAWRSLRYDMGHSPAEPPAGGPDVTSTGMGTFGLHVPIEGATPAPPAPRPRRAVALTAFGTLTVVGAAGAYLAVVNGLGSIMAESTAAAGTLPPRAAVTTAAGMGPSAVPPGRAPVATTQVVPPVVVPTPVDPATRTPGKVLPPPAHSPIRTPAARPASPECRCEPPVPTPTAPAASPSPTTTWPSPSPSPSESSDPPSSDPSPSDSADPGASASPSRSWDGRRHKRRH